VQRLTERWWEEKGEDVVERMILPVALRRFPNLTFLVVEKFYGPVSDLSFS